MSSQVQKTRRLRQWHTRRQWWVAPAAFVATLLAVPVNAGIVIPDDPLTTAARVAPNILFILDDSGSMADDDMPNQSIGTICRRKSTGACVDNSAITHDTYVGNTLYYNPAVTYQPWVKADGTRMTGGTSYGAAYGSFNLVGGTTINLGSAESCKRFNKNNNSTTDEFVTGGTNVCGGVQTFYVPKDTTSTNESYLRDASNYYRYQILAGGTDIKRSEFGSVVSNTSDGAGFPKTNLSQSRDGWLTYTVDVPANTSVLTISTSGGSGDGDLYVRFGAPPDLNRWDCRPYQSSNNETCTFNSPSAGTYHIGIHAYSAISAVRLDAKLATSNRCGSGTGSSDWINCQSALPGSRNLANELINFATWFSYHRTRMKAAKAGASDAFKPMGNNVRVGFRTIWERGEDHDAPIPVDDGNDGRFVDNPDDPNMAGDQSTDTRSTWYSRLHRAISYNGTPLHGALESAGEYFRDTSATGPYGPQATSAQYTCRQNFAILTTDGYWNSDSNYSGSYRDGGWSGGVGEQDNAAGAQITGPNEQGPDARKYTYSPVSPYKSSYGGTLADVAMKYWKTDLRPQANMTNNVPSNDADPAFWQHMVTFGISIGLAGTSGLNSVAQVLDLANVTWANPNDQENADRIDDLLHAAVNGHGAFVSASKPSEFTDGLSDALAAIDKRTSSYSNVATNSASLRTGAMVFNASYVAGIWTGDVKGYEISKADGVSETPEWSATIPAWSTRERKVYTRGGTFPTTAQEASLERTGGPVNYPATGQENANYIKGDQSNEGTGVGDLRKRTSLLGDIVGSSPEYVEDTNTLYVGANDGMLHAFDAEDGKELFAYVPGILDMTRLRDLSRGDYTHKFFVDGPVVASSRTLTPDKNLLVGTLGRGGRGLYALDVTNPAGLGSTPHLWEKTSGDTGFGNLGLVLGKPILARVSTGSTAVVLGNGVNSANDRAVLIIADLETGSLIAQIDTGEGDADNPNGLSAPTGVLGPDGKTLAYVYAGDMLGNVWKFDLSGSSSTEWKAIKLLTARAEGGTGAVQPITSGVAVATDPRTLNRWIFFGTGRFLTTSDAEDKRAGAQAMYGFIDEGEEIEYTDLVSRGLTGTGTMRAFDAKAGNALPSDKKGWYVSLPGQGERIVQDAQVESNVLVTASMIPTGDGCEASGSGYINALDAFTGTSTGSSYFDLDGDGTTTDETLNGVPVGSVNYGVGMPTLPILFPGRIVVGGTGGDGGGGGGAAGGGRKFVNTWSRVSWREIRRD